MISRRGFLRGAGGVVVLGMTASGLSVPNPGIAQQRGTSRRSDPGSGALEALVGRGGMIRIGLGGVVRSLEGMIPGAAQVTADGSQLAESAAGLEFRADAGGGVVRVTCGGRTGSGGVIVLQSAGSGENAHFQIPSGRFRGRLILRGTGSGFRVINELRIDDYLRGVLPAEIGDDAPLEALKAQAIAARSETMFKLAGGRHSADGFDLCDGVHCMAYKGMRLEKPASDRGALESAGVVLLFGGKVLDAVYHNVCGGVTAAAEDVWDGDPIPGLSPTYDSKRSLGPASLASDDAVLQFLRKTGEEVFCSPDNPGYPGYARKYFRWKKDFGAVELSRAAGVGRVRHISVVERRPSGRVRRLLVDGEAGRRVFEKELPIRRQFDLWSGLFALNVATSGGYVEAVSFVGGGNGHGVGMCQMGARTMAGRGFTAEQILGHYFPGAETRQVYRT